jgi:hypothetical protein
VPPGMLGIGTGAPPGRRCRWPGIVDGADRHVGSGRAQPRDKYRSCASSSTKDKQARHRRSRARRPLDRARRQDPVVPDARGQQADRHHPELRRDARAFRARDGSGGGFGRRAWGLARSPDPGAQSRRVTSTLTRDEVSGGSPARLLLREDAHGRDTAHKRIEHARKARSCP